MDVLEPRQAPARGLVVGLRVQLGEGVCEGGLGGDDGGAAEVGHLGDLVGEHLLDGVGLEDLGAGLGVGAVVEQGRDDLAVLGGAGEAAGAAGVEDAVDLAVGDERAAVQVAVRVDDQLPVGRPGVHVGQVFLHVRGREHVDVLEAQRLHDVLLEVLVQRQARYALDDRAGPVDVDPVLPHLARLVDERLTQVLPRLAGELVEARRPVEVVEAWIEERVAEPSWQSFEVSVNDSKRWGCCGLERHLHDGTGHTYRCETKAFGV